ncbi:hypothetical protein BD311DRAFT_778562 [Dichomitus squalens]|uniref:Uncharacterized protein n=1 Tax=Dichomitus squalens TaxID=114155 RepID=A0A4Q9MK47_9APHY|nr:hypothetical protein BD311DRAFT_778562 [Dichomitus squalens]
MRAPLRKLVIDCDNIISDFWHPAALEEFLPHLVPTLEEFEISDLLFTPQEATVHGAVTSASISSMAQYPAVHSLTVRGFAGPPFLEHLQHLFPSVDQKLALGRLDLDIDTLIYADIRNANKSAQKEGSPDYLRPWKQLDLVVCDVPMFYVLGLRCPIRHAMLDYGWSHYRGYLTDALRENPVPRLELSIALSYGLCAFDELFPLELVPTLTHLTLCLVYANMGGSGTDADAGFDFRWRDVLLFSSLGRLRALTHLRLVIHTDVCHDPPESEPYSEAFVNDLRGPTFGFQETAQVLANALPSLRYVFLTTSGYLGKHDESTRYFWKAYERWLVSRAWRIADKGGEQRREGLILVELAEAVAETLIDQEELVLSPADEISLHIGED